MDIAALSDLRQARRLVIKVGSALLVDKGRARTAWLASLAEEIAELRQTCEVLLVSSGAIALGAARLGLPHGGRGSLADAQAAASVGQVELARLWSDALGAQDITAAQMLVTLGDLEDRRRYLNVSATLGRLLAAGAVPVVNENDSVATEEIRFGDNDRLAARIAQAAGADAVLLLSDVDGLFDRDPREPGARRIARVDGVSPEIMAMATADSGSGLGSGGMRAKLQAARIAERAGIALAIINGTRPAPFAAALAQDSGTVFVPQSGASARKAWLGGRLAPAGSVTVDQGCMAALDNGASVLAAGVTAVEGDFVRGDLVAVHGPGGERLGQGLVEYAAAECRAIMGLREDQQARTLGYAPRAAVVHRDHMVRL
ncbi:MAG TPA: glutamate 5-kinase [Erythrobacter sp.]|nr:glutamate 5-kinase [Erythrobacter sp.]|tara:strand:- start:2016 stop:3134 length:1119 start_codon:yes stop_codon:yes gene_type:complete